MLLRITTQNINKIVYSYIYYIDCTINSYLN